MAIPERKRHELYEKLQQIIGVDETSTLMEYLPPVGWGDVARQKDIELVRDELARTEAAIHKDLAELEARIDLRFQAADFKLESTVSTAIASQTKTIIYSNVAMVATLSATALAIARLH